MNFVIDTDALIKLTKSSSKELTTTAFTIAVPPLVLRESVDEGKAGGHPDALPIEDNVRRGLLRVRRGRRVARVEAAIRSLGLRGGEADALRVFHSGRFDGVVSDDRRFLQVLEAMGVPYATPASLLVALVRAGELSREEGQRRLDRLAGFISGDEYMEARRSMKEE